MKNIRGRQKYDDRSIRGRQKSIRGDRSIVRRKSEGAVEKISDGDRNIRGRQKYQRASVEKVSEGDRNIRW